MLTSLLILLAATPAPPANNVTKTLAPMVMYVDVRGNDANTCLAPFTDGGTNGPCRQPQGAINKLPKALRHQVSVSVDAGTYDCFYLSGFSCDTGLQQANGGLLIDGVLVNATLATGSATGTATAGTAGTGLTYGTLTDGAATWTTNDLAGRFVTAGGQTRVISSNTGTVITITGTWTNPGAVPYTIQDPGANITTACSSPPTPIAAASANSAAIQITGNTCDYRSQAMVLRGLRTSNTAGAGIFISDASLGLVTLSQLRPTAASRPAIDVGAAANASTGTGVGRWDLTDVDVAPSSTGNGVAIHRGLTVVSRVLVRGGDIGLSLESLSASASVSTADFQGCTAPVSTLRGGGLLTAMSGTRIACANSSGIGIQLGNTINSQGPLANAIISEATISTCGTGVQATGSASSADLSGVTGSAATTGLVLRSGAAISLTSSVSLTGGTSDYSVDGTTGAFSGISTGTCVASSGFLSSLCKR